MTDQPLPELRRIQILAHVRRNGGASISQLAREHSISPVTVHRDLEVLATEGLITRIRGGARAIEGDTRGGETHFLNGGRRNPASKNVLASHALADTQTHPTR